MHGNLESGVYGNAGALASMPGTSSCPGQDLSLYMPVGALDEAGLVAAGSSGRRRRDEAERAVR